MALAVKQSSASKWELADTPAPRPRTEPSSGVWAVRAVWAVWAATTPGAHTKRRLPAAMPAAPERPQMVVFQ
eukprot:194505-Chlamydomonas_euryale.AAC.3